MNKRVLEILEYQKIIGMLAEETGSDLSRAMAEHLTPGSDRHDIEEGLRSTTEAVDLIVRKGALPTEGLYNVSDAVSLARKGGVLTTRELLQIQTDLRMAQQVVTFMKGDLPPLPQIRELVDLIRLHPQLESDIGRCILSEDEIADRASRELFQIRKNIHLVNEQIRRRLEKIAGSAANQPYLRDAIVTMRDGRYVIPVKSEHKSRFPGIVHDQSKAGSTLFIEPQVIIDMNNELKELELAEQEEIQKILRDLSEHVGEVGIDLQHNQELITELDFIMAKGKLSCRMQGAEPKIDPGKPLILKDARHPLLDPEKAVPVSVELGGNYRTLVITGPNTGGKTLTLKTIGLLQLMAQSGLHIPASSESSLPIYQYIFADIGDEQSIEQSLSTFSSHMKNIVFITRKADQRTLVLLDELGGGTDPTEGAALAVSVLEELRQRKATTAATTHYNEVKKYALSSEDVENASMEFNVETLSPTYRLMIGVPGRSNAFEISKKLGLPKRIIDRASRMIERGDLEFEDVISAIDEDRRKAEDERREADRIYASMKAEKEQFEEEKKRLEKEKDQILVEARRQARRILKDARDTAHEVQKDLNKIQKMESLGERNKALASSKHKLKKKETRYAEHIVQRVNSNPVEASQLAVGDRVEVLSLHQKGDLLTLPDEKDHVVVQLGIAKMTVPLKDLVLLNDGSAKANKKKTVSAHRSSSGIRRRKTMSVSTSIDVRGKNADDARMDVEKYMDDVYISGLKEVTIIHGRGEGILKQEIRRLLKRNPHIASIRPGNYNEGGEGVTIVKMKDE